jgi:hypothetical protein
MNTLAENNVNFEFQSSKIVKVCLGKSGILSTPVIRELAVYSKVKNGKSADAYIICLESSEPADANLYRVITKARRFAPEVLIAVVYPSNSLEANLQNFRHNLKPAGRTHVFATYLAALTWIENKLNNTSELDLSDSLDLFGELIA